MRSRTHQATPWLLGVWLCGGAWGVGAQELTFSAKVDKTEVQLGDPIQLTVTVSGDIEGIELPAFEFPEGFVVSGRSHSTNFTLRAGKAQRSMSLVYGLVPQRAGTFLLGPFYLQRADEVIPTEPIEITIEKPTLPPFLKPQGERFTI